MNTYLKTVLGILGTFWTLIWKDSWLVLGLGQIFSFLIYPAYNKVILNLYRQTAVQNTTLLNTSIPTLVILLVLTKHAKKKISLLVIGQSLLGLSDSKLYAYKIVHCYLGIDKLSNAPVNATYDVADLTTDGLFVYTPDDLSKKNTRKAVYTANQDISVCYQMWGTKHKTSVLVDNFARIALVPTRWALQYPGAVLDAWVIRQFGTTLLRAKSLIGKVTECPVASCSGVVSKILNSTVYILNTPHKCWSEKAILVTVGQRVPTGTPLCAFSLTDHRQVVRVYSGEVPSGTLVNSIPVVTSNGILYALNNSLLHNSGSLPLSGASVDTYNRLCASLRTAINVPYVSVPDGAINPLSFLVLLVWGKSCVIINIPTRNQADLEIAIACIINNMPVGCIPIVYKYDVLEKPILINLTYKSLVLAYYSSSVNHTLIKEITLWA